MVSPASRGARRFANQRHARQVSSDALVGVRLARKKVRLRRLRYVGQQNGVLAPVTNPRQHCDAIGDALHNNVSCSVCRSRSR
eukprot:6203395-Pleurochrysis_carterae.AAC.3